MSTEEELYACLHVPEFPAQSLLRLRPDLRDRPLVVLKGDPPFQNVFSLNTKARLAGIARHMTLSELESFPVIEQLFRSQTAEESAKKILLDCAGAFSPRIEDCSRDIEFLCCLDASGTEKLFGPQETFARSLLKQVRELGFYGRITLSRNLSTAMLVARSLRPGVNIKIIPAGAEPGSLSPLQIALLDLEESHSGIFSSWGIETLGKLASLPEKQLVSRIGQAGKRLRQLALGQWKHCFQPSEVPLFLEERLEFDYPVEQLDALLLALAVLLDRVLLRARMRIIALASITVTLKLEGGGVFERSIRPALPTNDKQFWIKLAHLDLATHSPQKAVTELALSAEPGATNKIQLGLFAPQLPEAGRLEVTLARLRALVGENNVGAIALEDTHAPEGFHLAPFVPPKPDLKPIVPTSSCIALRRLRPPQKISMQLRNGSPGAFFFRQRRYQVVNVYGPWANSGNWWSQSVYNQEQWDIVAQTAQERSLLCCLVEHDLNGDLWRLAGIYD